MIFKKRHAAERGSWYANSLNNIFRILAFAFLLIAAGLVYRYLFGDIITGHSHFFAYIAVWLFTAYVILPRIYRTFSRLILPDYFFGRTQTSDGLLGDPINLAVNGHEYKLIEVMKQAGWVPAEKLTIKSGIKMAYSAVRGAQYPNAPVSALFLFGKKQGLAFEKDLAGNPRKRHHVRFWKTPEDWWLPGGYQTDWLGAATFDKNVGLSLFTGQITHKIDSNIDKERDFVLDSISDVKLVKEIKIVKHFTTSYHSRNGGGSFIHTDGSLPFINLED